MRLRQAVILTAFLSSICSLSIRAQSSWYDMDQIREVRLYFSQANWNEILDSLYVIGESERLGGDVVIDGTRYEDIGVRYKGFSSYSSDRYKNPFNIELDYVYADQNHHGVSQIKLSNVIQDPSFVREVLAYEVARKYMPASRANYANVYVNDTLIGLYSNVESVSNPFLLEHFASSDGAFFKCNPETLDLNGENANLNAALGTEVDAYYPFYKLKSAETEDWSDLLDLIINLNDPASDITKILNVDRTLWMHALNYGIINFDSYVGYAQNYYLYQDADGRFNPILWDLNMSFASYRLTDASDNWDGFTIQEAKTIDPLQHYLSVSVQPRPLMRVLFENDRYRRMYLAHLRTLMEENFSNQWYAQRAAELQNLIDASVQADTNKFYSYADFHNNLNNTVSDLVDYPGITDLMDGRSAYLSTYPGMQGAPEIVTVYTNPAVTAGDTISITAEIVGDPVAVLLAYRMGGKQHFESIYMYDDGQSNDGTANDGVFGARILGITNRVEYYVYAENDSAGVFSPTRAAFEFYSLDAGVRPGDLVINEAMAANLGTASDQNGEYDPWVELYNNGSYPIALKSFYLSNDKSVPLKWTFPETTIAPGEYLIVWVDGDTLQTGLHCNFNLDSAGDSLWLSDPNGGTIDSLAFGPQEVISSFGRSPNGTGNFMEMIPSFNDFNNGATAEALTNSLFLFPNPASDEVWFRLNLNTQYTIHIHALDGREITSLKSPSGLETRSLSVAQWPVGIYLVNATIGEENTTLKLMITH